MSNAVKATRWEATWRGGFVCSCGRRFAFPRRKRRAEVEERLERYLHTPSSAHIKGVRSHTARRSPAHWVGVVMEVQFQCWACHFRTNWISDNSTALLDLKAHDCEKHRAAIETLRMSEPA